MTLKLVLAMGISCEKGSIKQAQQIFQIGIIHALAPALKNNNKTLQQYILLTFYSIIMKGWKNQQQFSSFSSTIQSSSQQQSLIQQLLNSTHIHPYMSSFEQQGIITIIIENILLIVDVDIRIKKYACDVFDALFLKGAQFDSNNKIEIINQICQQTKSNIGSQGQCAFGILSCLAINQENHELIIFGSGIEVSTQQFMKKVENKLFDVDTIKQHLLLFINLYIYGNTQTQQLIQRLISLKDLNFMKQYQQLDEALLLTHAYKDAQGIKVLMIIRRIVERRSEEGLIELMHNGLLNILNEMIEKTIKENEGDLKVIIIGEIMEQLIKDNPETSRIIIQETNFIERYLCIINSISLFKFKEGYLNPLNSITLHIPHEQNNYLFQKGIINSITKLIICNDQNIREKSIGIISRMIESGLKGLKIGQQYPYKQLLIDDGSINQFIQLLKDKNKQCIHKDIAQMLCRLFKSSQLPQDINVYVIQILKTYGLYPDFECLALLAECPCMFL